ncbi:hypothetical protein Maes01_01709 [Microbulbifer aestuariivivens]|uniref:Uncharacterized protein n=1 Tax=Microbulbifer aestuariivivens TaxID=1908308 RepID=A0ABP9WQ40_9GAMM
MNFSEPEKQLIQAAFVWGQIAQQQGYTLSDLDIEKSVLLHRLLSGRPPLAFPPPLRHGFPWYEVIEGGDTFIVNVSEATADADTLMSGKAARSTSGAGDTCIMIEGSPWRVAASLRTGEEYIVEWGRYPMQWRLCKHWQVNDEMTLQLQRFRAANPAAEAQLEPAVDQREYGELRVDEMDTVWHSQWHLTRIGLSGWIWLGTPEEPPHSKERTPLHEDSRGPLLLGDSDTPRGSLWLRVEEAEGESRFIQLGGDCDYQQLVRQAKSDPESLIHCVQGDTLRVMDCHGLNPLRQVSIPAQLAPWENFELGLRAFELVPENAHAD